MSCNDMIFIIYQQTKLRLKCLIQKMTTTIDYKPINWTLNKACLGSKSI